MNLNKIYIAFLCVLISSFFLSFKKQFKLADNLILWNRKYKLSWRDFQGVLPSSSTRTAVTYLVTPYDVEVIDSVFHLDTGCYFNRKKSKKKKYVCEGEYNFLLNHESMHFNLGEYIQRRERKALLEYEYTSLDTFYETWNRILDSLLSQDIELHRLYDKETNHSKIKTSQEKWNKKILLMLDSLKEYSDPIVKIDLREIAKRNKKLIANDEINK